MSQDPVADQSSAALDAVRHGLDVAKIVGVYLYGSAVTSGLRPDSDLDLFVVTDRRLTHSEKAAIVAGMLPISGRNTRPARWRPIEVTIVAEPEIRPCSGAARMELQYGEWLREEMLAGKVEPQPAENPDLGVLLTMVRGHGQPLVGPPAADLIDAIPAADMARSMLDGVPSLMADLEGDTRNVLLTLARVWFTLETGEIRSKDEAADWAISRLPDAHRSTLRRARDLYRSGGYGDPWDVGARRLADQLLREIEQTSHQSR